MRFLSVVLFLDKCGISGKYCSGRDEARLADDQIAYKNCLVGKCPVMYHNFLLSFSIFSYLPNILFIIIILSRTPFWRAARGL